MATGAIEVSGDVAAAGGVLAGLILVYIGSVVASYAGYPDDPTGAIRTSHRRRAWFAFGGLSFSLVALWLALISKRLEIPCLGDVALVVLTLALVWVVVTAVLSILEIS